MELDELKKSWNTLNEQLDKNLMPDDKQISTLITQYKTNADKSLRRLTGWQRLSIGIGFVVLTVLLVVCLLPSIFHIGEAYLFKINILTLFFAISILVGVFWDYRTYRSVKTIHIDEMPVAEVSRRMNAFRQMMKVEVIAISVWVILFNILNYWAMEYYNESVRTQIFLILFFILCDVIIIYFLYKKIAYKHLNKIKKNIEDLEDICPK